MTIHWQALSPIAWGGTVFDTLVVQDKLWLLTEAGLFLQDDTPPRQRRWQTPPQPNPLLQMTALTGAALKPSATKTDSPAIFLLVGNALGQIAYSTDTARHWHLAHIPQSKAAITCFALSPNFFSDGVALAGTNGGGILRTKDGGQRWELVNVGLQNFEILDLAMVPTWQRREICFAATAQGVYRSPNGGRAWKASQVGLGEILCYHLAVSPDFLADETVLVTTENRGLYRSHNGGHTWHQLDFAFKLNEAESASQATLNCLWLHPNYPLNPTCLLGTGDGRIVQSTNNGQTWRTVLHQPNTPIYSLAAIGQRIYAATGQAGLLESVDGGQQWQFENSLAAQPFQQLHTLPNATRPDVYAFGGLAGLWHSPNGGAEWQALSPPTPDALLALALSPHSNPPTLLLGTTRHLLRSADSGQSWQTQQIGAGVTALCFCLRHPKRAWLGLENGQVMASHDEGRTWFRQSPPQPGAIVVKLVSTPQFLLALTCPNQGEALTLWQAELSENHNILTWHRLQQFSIAHGFVHLQASHTEPLCFWVAQNQTLWHVIDGHWQAIFHPESPILNLELDPVSKRLLVITYNTVWQLEAASKPQPYFQTPASHTETISLLDAAILPEMDLLLGVGGQLWQGQGRSSPSQ